jgi:tryptophanyl-tRNA synthetase
MFTDPQRVRKNDPGNPEICNVFTFHGLYSPKEEVKQIDVDCRKAGIGCTDCKKMLAQYIASDLSPVHERMDYYASHLAEIEAIIEEGNAKATKIARQTMDEVRAAVKI